MKKILTILLLTLMVSCDPISNMDATVTNTTLEPLSIVFVSANEPSETFVLEPNMAVQVQDGFAIGGAFLEPSFIKYDSIYIVNQVDEIRKVFKENTQGKNIYDINTFWQFNEPEKRFYKYAYKVNSQDLE